MNPIVLSALQVIYYNVENLSDLCTRGPYYNGYTCGVYKGYIDYDRCLNEKYYHDVEAHRIVYNLITDHVVSSNNFTLDRAIVYEEVYSYYKEYINIASKCNNMNDCKFGRERYKFIRNDNVTEIIKVFSECGIKNWIKNEDMYPTATPIMTPKVINNELGNDTIFIIVLFSLLGVCILGVFLSICCANCC